MLWRQVHFMHKRPRLWPTYSGEPWMSRGPGLCQWVSNLDWNEDAFTLVTRYGDPDVPGTGQCVDYDRATACKTFNQPTTPCLYSCPRWVGRGWPKLEFSGDTSPCFDSKQCVTYLYVLGCTWSQLGWGRSRRLEGLDASGFNIFVIESLCYWYWWVFRSTYKTFSAINKLVL